VSPSTERRAETPLRITRDDGETIEQLVALDALPDDWRSYFAKRLAKNGSRRQASSGLDNTTRRNGNNS
jgi:hypothetical protein